MTTNSPTKFETSSGGIVFYVENEKDYKFLLLKHKNGDHWDLPKGHTEEGETLKETALREIIEETGIQKENLRFIKNLNHKNVYEFQLENFIIQKTVYLFLFESKISKIFLSDEHSDFSWVPFQQVFKILTYKTSYPAFIEAFQILSI